MGVRQADITTPGTAVHSGVDLPASGERVDGLDIVGNIAYQAITGNGFAIVDITDPTAPKDLGSFTKGPNNCHGVHVVGNYAYLAYGGYGLVILDISNPKNPVEVGSIDPGAYSVDVKVQGSYAYLANDDNVQIIDITDPMNPSIAFVIGTTNHTYDLAVDGNRLLIGEKTSGLTIYDISDPTLPILKSTTAPKNTISTVVIKNNLAYVSDGTFGLRIFDISNLAAPKEVGSLPSIDMVGDILIDGNKLYASTSVGIGVYTLDNPIAPISMGSFQAGFTIAYELIVRGNYLHIANKTGGYKVFTK